MAAWRSQVEPRGVVVVFPAKDRSPVEMAGVANRILDAGFNYAFVEPPAPLAARIAVGTAIAHDKSLGARQWLESGRPREPTITLLWFDDDDGEALELLRAQHPFMVQAAIVGAGSSATQRHILTNQHGELPVLEVPGPLDGAGQRDVIRFIDEVEHALLCRPALLEHDQDHRRRQGLPVRDCLSRDRPAAASGR